MLRWWLRRFIGLEAIEARLAALEEGRLPQVKTDSPDARRREVELALARQVDSGARPGPPGEAPYYKGVKDRQWNPDLGGRGQYL